MYESHLPDFRTEEDPGGMNWDQYLVYMATDGNWADEITTSATSAMLSIRIRVYWVNPESHVFEAYVGGGDYGGGLPVTARLANLFHVNEDHFVLLPQVVVNAGIPT